jgi:type I restriction enzyme S subunit
MNAINKGIVSNKISGLSEEWIKTRLGDSSNFEIIMGQSPPSSLYNTKREGLPFLQGKMDFGGVFPSPSVYCSKPVKIADKNDILISVRAPVGDVNISPSRVCIGRGLASIRCDAQKISYVFLFYFLKHKKTVFENISSGSTFKAIRRNELDNFEILLPSPDEQRKIADILSTVDQAIEKVGEAIKKTQRLKKGLMQELLTEGIGHKEFKIAKIGKMPQEWTVVVIADIAKVRYGMGQPPELDKNGIPMVRATNIKSGRIFREGLIHINPKDIPPGKNASLREGEIIVVRSGAYTGDIGLVTKEWEGAVAGYDLVLSPQGSVNSEYLVYYLLSSAVQRRYFSGLKVRSAQPHLNSSQVGKTPIALPPLSEQEKIAEILGSSEKRIELLRIRKERLEKIKKGLMEDLLTGGKRVSLEA